MWYGFALLNLFAAVVQWHAAYGAYSRGEDPMTKVLIGLMSITLMIFCLLLAQQKK